MMLPLSLSYDHRAIDGATAGRFTTFLAARLADTRAAARSRAVSRRDLVVPDLGDFKDVPVIDVLVKVGDSIEVDAPLITLETEKASMDVPAAAAGKIVEVLVKRGDKVSAGSADRAAWIVRARLRSRQRRAPLRRARADAPAAPAPETRRDAKPGRAAAPAAAKESDADRTDAASGAGLGSCRLHGRVSRGGPGAEGDARRALEHARRRLPQRRLHSLEGAAARGQSHRGCRCDERARHCLRRARN